MLYKNLVKKVSIALAMSVLTVALAGCGSGNSDNKDSAGTVSEQAGEPSAAVQENGAADGQNSASAEQETAQKEEPEAAGENAGAAGEAAEDKQEASAETTEKPEKKEDAPQEDTFVSDRSAVFELLSNMNVGWNLGNTFDAWGAGNSLRDEVYWGNPETTQEMIDALAAQGFNTIRIPVTWAEHVGFPPDYEINAEWLDRVQAVVDYAVANDMYIILDTHHEPDFWMSPDPAKADKVEAELVAIWTQIAERFKDYDEKLLFEGMNENRIKGSAQEWNGGTPEERVVINRLNQAFVDAVRATGGNNETRCLIISPYGNNAGRNALEELAIPNDNNIAVAVHMYLPFTFTYDPDDGSSQKNWDGSQKKDLAASMKQVEKYLMKKDVPAIITEFGAVNKENEDQVALWIADYMQQANKYGLKCIWWDNGIYRGSGEKFGIFDRNNLTWYSQKIADTLVECSQTGLAETE